MRAKNIYDIGDNINLTVTPRDPVTEKAVQPDSVVCTVQKPDGTKATPEVTGPDKQGLYTAVFAATESGVHRYAWDGSGKWAGAEEREFKVRPRKVER